MHIYLIFLIRLQDVFFVVSMLCAHVSSSVRDSHKVEFSGYLKCTEANYVLGLLIKMLVHEMGCTARSDLIYDMLLQDFCL